MQGNDRARSNIKKTMGGTIFFRYFFQLNMAIKLISVGIILEVNADIF